MSLRMDQEKVKKFLEDLIKQHLFEGNLLKKYLETKFLKFNVKAVEFDLGEVRNLELAIKGIEEPTKELIERSPPVPHIDSNDMNIMVTVYVNASLSGVKVKLTVDGEVNFPLSELARTNKATISISELSFEDIFRATIINGYFTIWLEPKAYRFEPKFKIEFEEYKHLNTNPLEVYIMGMMKGKIVGNGEIRNLFSVPFCDLLRKVNSS
jgi:hypothetical protein